LYELDKGDDVEDDGVEATGDEADVVWLDMPDELEEVGFIDTGELLDRSKGGGGGSGGSLESESHESDELVDRVGELDDMGSLILLLALCCCLLLLLLLLLLLSVASNDAVSACG
jgi:hypothetical protein